MVFVLSLLVCFARCLLTRLVTFSLVAIIFQCLLLDITKITILLLLPPFNLAPIHSHYSASPCCCGLCIIYGGVFKFICAQSPHSMKGFLIGIFFAIKGLFQLIGVLGILLPFSFWQESPRAGLIYFLVNILISVAGVVAFIVAAKRYQY